mgnify:FL=1
MYTNEQFNLIINKYKSITDELSSNYNYPENIRHLLYIIIPAFIIKYNLENERIIIDIFKNIPIIINDVNDTSNPALFTRQIKKINNEYLTVKNIIIKNYRNAGLLPLLDSLIHEYNHAINSIKNEIIIKDNQIYLRTGIAFNKYDINLTYIKNENITLEEIINTNDSEEIINLIKGFNKYEISDYEIRNTIEIINREIGNNYTSKAYYLQSFVCKSLLENRTFINTLKKLRFSGNIEDIDYWFDNITGKKDSFKTLNKLLNDSLQKEKELSQIKFFKNRKINQIRYNIIETNEIIKLFDNNCNIR